MFWGIARLLLYSISLLTVAAGTAVAQTVLWQSSFSPGVVGRITVDPWGNPVLAGVIPTGGANSFGLGNTDLLTAKLDGISGSLTWLRTWDGAIAGPEDALQLRPAMSS